jgi:Uma2 family endonuclease
MIASSNTMLRSPGQTMLGDRAYPTRDGRPMGETDLHRRLMFDLINRLERYYAGQQVYVSGNLLMFYEPGNKRRHVSPDVLVTKGLQPGLRLNYILWQERLPPNIVIEVTSKTTRKEDLEKKFAIYRDIIRVSEYFLFDPYGEYLDPPLRGHRLKRGQYVPIAPSRGGRLHSEQLGIDLVPEYQSLALVDRKTGERLMTADEVAEDQADEIARLQREIKNLRKK